MEQEPPSQRSAVICALAGDSRLERLVEDAGISVIGVASSSFAAENMIKFSQPDLIVLDISSVGETGYAEVGRMHEISPKSQVLLITTESWSPADSGAVGAFSVITKAQLGRLAEEIGALVEWLDEEKNLDERDRRRGRDRRVHQDWQKVGWERRQSSRRSRLAAEAAEAAEG